MFWVIYLILLIPLVSSKRILVSEESQTDDYGARLALMNDLFINYSSELIPVRSSSVALQLTMQPTITNLQSFDIVTGQVMTAVRLVISWKDEKLVWNSNNYANVSNIGLSIDDVWTPVVQIVNSVGSLEFSPPGKSQITMQSNGQALQAITNVIITQCVPDITRYPFDEHECQIQFSVPHYSSSVTISDRSEGAIQTKSNSIWDIHLVKSTVTSVLAPGVVSGIEISLRIRRRPEYLTLVLLVPLMVLNIVHLLVFIIPPESGERVSFSVTVLLTLSVYITIMSDRIPNTSDPVSFLTIDVMIKLVNSGAITAVIAVLLKLYHKNNDENVPAWLTTLLLFGRHARKTSPTCGLITNNVEINKNSNEDSYQTPRDNTEINNQELPKFCKDNVRTTWMCVCAKMDKIALMFFGLVSFVESVVAILLLTK